MFVTFSHLSLGQVSQHYAVTNGGTDWLKPVFGALVLITLLLTFAIWVLASLIYVSPNNSIFGAVPSITFIIGLMFVPLMIWEVYSSSLLFAIDKLETYNRAQIYGRTLGLLMIVILVWRLDMGVDGTLLAMLVSQAMVAMYGINTLLTRLTSGISIQLHVIHVLLKGGLRLHLNAIGVFLFSNINILIIQHYTNPAEAAFYQLAAQITMAMLIIPQSVAQLLFGKLSDIGPSGIWALQKKVMSWAGAIMIAAGLIVFYFAEGIVLMIASKSFLPTVEVLRIYLLALVGGTINAIMAVQWIGRGLFLQTSVLTFSSGIVNFSLNMIMIPQFGAIGAAWATVAGVYLVPFAANVIFARRIENNCKLINNEKTAS